MEFILFIVAQVLKLVLGCLMLIFGTLVSIYKREAGKYYMNMAISIDCFGNAMGKYLLNTCMIKKGGHSFGNYKETISYVLGKNYQTKTLTKFGIFIGRILNKLDTNHLNKSVTNHDTK